ncbi:MAG: hypothetical protein CMM46_15570 [Rhodospirillaceae bacterium]|nr:hypothetical protein [Rhodospirillaceae bacterium]
MARHSLANETRKTNALRSANFLRTYLAGRVIDDLRPNAAYDAVHWSHCLEHMFDPPAALTRWWELVKPGGYLIVVITDKDLYEQGLWPSIYNSDHKATFRLWTALGESWSPGSHEIDTLARTLPDAVLLSADRQDQHYNHDLLRLGYANVHSNRIKRRYDRFLQDLAARRLLTSGLMEECHKLFFDLVSNIDQTVGRALAQIQIVVRKRTITKHADGRYRIQPARPTLRS